MARAAGESKGKVLATNRKARHLYHLVETYEAGIALQGTEVKSIRQGRVSLSDSHGEIRKGEVFLRNLHVSPYEQGNINNHDPLRARKLLLHRREIRKLIGKVEERGMTLIPVQIYLKNGKVKVELALALGKKVYDRRETIKKRDMQRDEGREWKIK